MRERERERVRPLKAFSVAYGSDSEIDGRISEKGGTDTPLFNTN